MTVFKWDRIQAFVMKCPSSSWLIKGLCSGVSLKVALQCVVAKGEEGCCCALNLISLGIVTELCWWGLQRMTRGDILGTTPVRGPAGVGLA